jgi:hypothetical protein
MTWVFFAAGLGIFSLFAETGPNKYVGNLSWPYQISLCLLFALSMRHYYRLAHVAYRSADFRITSGLLLCQIASGLYYLFQLLMLGDYY